MVSGSRGSRSLGWRLGCPLNGSAPSTCATELQRWSRSRPPRRPCPPSSTRRPCRCHRARCIHPPPARDQALADAKTLRQPRRPHAGQEGLCNHPSPERRVIGAPPLAHDLNPKLRSCHYGCHTRHHAPDTLNAKSRPNQPRANKAAITRRLPWTLAANSELPVCSWARQSIQLVPTGKFGLGRDTGGSPPAGSAKSPSASDRLTKWYGSRSAQCPSRLIWRAARYGSRYRKNHGGSDPEPPPHSMGMLMPAGCKAQELYTLQLWHLD